MCTLTVIPTNGGRRFAVNRDELRSRSIAEPPEIHSFGNNQAILPRDPDGGGTWVAVNDAGIFAALLNRNPGGPPQTPAIPKVSRGTIIPGVMPMSTLDEIEEYLVTLDATRFSPFRLVVSDGDRLTECVGEFGRLRSSSVILDQTPWMATSSGLGDALVEPPRRELFTQTFVGSVDGWPDRQVEFHRHVWPDRSELSVCMRRKDALTVSHTLVEIDNGQVTMRYQDGPPDEPAKASVLSLPRVRVHR